ncbi:MAG TPA: electron transport complex subunit RsxD, partial [Gammaproteobacteria bacterium]|nr:electron transport complex subunit RsxD [Gammaproteobacteria bacterium]
MTPGRPISSPFLHGTGSVTRLMAWVVISLLPVIAVSTWLFGLRVLIHLAVAVATAVFAEAVIMRLRQRPVVRALADGSAAVTALLLALCLP